MDALEAAEAVKAIMINRFSSACEGSEAARIWYDENIDVWDPAKLATHAPEEARSALAGVALEGSPEGERAPDCWGVEISEDPEVLSAIPGWYLECWACWLVLLYRTPTDDERRRMSTVT